MGASRIYAAREDGNAKELTARALAHGVSVERLKRPLDRLWGLGGVDQLVEYKNPATRYGRAGLTEGQEKFVERWRGSRPVVVATEEDVDRVVKWMRARAAALQMAGLRT